MSGGLLEVVDPHGEMGEAAGVDGPDVAVAASAVAVWSDVFGENGIKIDHLEAVDSPNWIPNLIAQKSNVVKYSVLNNAGARRADGEAVDLRIISDVINGTGRIIDSQDDVGGWPPLANNVRGSGSIPELDIPSNPHEIQWSGYTKVEEWLHLLAKQVEVPR